MVLWCHAEVIASKYRRGDMQISPTKPENRLVTQFPLFPTCELSLSALLGNSRAHEKTKTAVPPHGAPGGSQLASCNQSRRPLHRHHDCFSEPNIPAAFRTLQQVSSENQSPFQCVKKEDRESYDQPPLTREANSLSGRSATLKKKTNKHALALFSPAHVAQQLFP